MGIPHTSAIFPIETPSQPVSRPLRLEYPGALWHVFSRGNERRPIFVTDADRELFLDLLGSAVETFRWILHDYCLMTNHYHLVIETPETTLSRGIHQINGEYAAKFNRLHDRVGHLFQGRYRGIIVEKDSHLLELTRYVVLNPVRADLCRLPSDWIWSSYRARAGLATAPAWLEVDWTLRRFHPSNREAARAGYCRFVAEGIGLEYDLMLEVKGQILGTDEFRKKLNALVGAHEGQREFPRDHRRPYRATLDTIVSAVSGFYHYTVEQLRNARGTEARAAFTYIARTEGATPLPVLANFLRISEARVSRMIRRAKAQASEDAAFRDRLDSIIRRARNSE